MLFIDFTVVFYPLRRNSDRVRYLRHRRVYTTRPVGCYYAINVRGKGHRGGVSSFYAYTRSKRRSWYRDDDDDGGCRTLELERLINDVDTTPQYICVCVSEWWQTHDETAPLSRGRKYDEDTWYLHEKINIIFKKKEKKMAAGLCVSIASYFTICFWIINCARHAVTYIYYRNSIVYTSVRVYTQYTHMYFNALWKKTDDCRLRGPFEKY